MTQQHTTPSGWHPSAHPHDRGLSAFLRYARLLARLWRSDLNSAVVHELALRPHERVVDLGAGAGAATVEAARTGAHVVAVDPSPFMRGMLRVRRLGHGRRPFIDVRSGAAESIPLEDHSVDALWSVNTLHHWTNRETAVHELARVLKPGARFLLLDEDVDNPSHPQHQLYSSHRHKLHFDEVEPMTWAADLQRMGFAHAEGSHTVFAGRPVKWIRGIR